MSPLVGRVLEYSTAASNANCSRWGGKRPWEVLRGPKGWWDEARPLLIFPSWVSLEHPLLVLCSAGKAEKWLCSLAKVDGLVDKWTDGWLGFSFFLFFQFYWDIIDISARNQFSRSVVSDPWWLHELQHARPACPSPTPGTYPNSCPLSRWYHPTISSSAVPFSFCLQSFPTSGSFQMSQLFTSGGQSIGNSASALVLPMNIQDWFPLEWTGWISLQTKYSP